MISLPLLFCEPARILEESRSDGPKDYAGDVRDISHAARLYVVRHDAKNDKLDKKPKSAGASHFQVVILPASPKHSGSRRSGGSNLPPQW
jgi:hypothetical protein